jgi:class 3 adenylate cyclase
VDGEELAGATGDRLPSGLVTFLLSDVVGSTRLWEAVPELMTDALERHDELVARAVSSRGGVLLKSKGEGDSTFSVFRRPADAAAAALLAQRSMFDEPWPEECRIAVRIALHTGEAVERDRDYFGRTVNRAARLRAIAGPGDVLASKVTADLVVNQLPAGARLIELGVEQLRDLDGPETVYLLTERDDVAQRPRGSTTRLPLPSRLRAATMQPFVGRERERALIDAAWARVVDGRPAFVILEGEPGIGKSRLAAEVASSLYDDGVTVLAGRCDDLRGSPFQPFADAYRFVSERSAPGSSHVAVDKPGVLATLAPHLVPDRRDVGSTADVELEREQLFAAVGAWFESLCRVSPVVFVVDDLQWATETTVQMLRTLLLDGTPSRMLVLATARAVAASTDPVQTLVTDAHRFAFSFDHIFLGGLSLADTEALLGTAPMSAAHDAAAVHASTAGNPLFALAIGSSTRAAGPLSGSVGARSELPASVHAVIDRQVAALGMAARSFLEAAAILGTTFEVDLAAQLSEAPFEVVEETLDRGEHHLILREQSAGALHLYEFSHALFASALTDQLTAIRRRKLHAGAARILSAAGMVDGDRISRVAYHADHAGTALPALEAIGAFRAAGLNARSRMALREAVDWLERAHSRLDGIDDDRLATEVDIEYGAAKHAAGDPDAEAILIDAGDRALQLDDGELLALALLPGDTGGSNQYLGVDEHRVALLDEALALLPLGDSALRASVLVMLAGELTYSDAEGRRFRLADDALAMARRLGDPRLVASVLEDRFSLFAGPAFVEQRLAETDEFLSMLDAGVPGPRRFAWLGFRSHVLEQLTRVEEGRACVAEMRAMAEADQLLPRQQLTYSMVLAGWHLLSGELAAAEAEVRAAFRQVKALGVETVGAATARQMLGVRFWQDRTDTMLDAIAFGVTINPTLRAHHSYWLLQAGHLEESARAWAEWDDDGLEAMLAVGGTGESVVIEAAAVCAAFDGRDRCRVYYDLLAPFGDRIVNPFAPDQPTHHYLGLLAHAMHDDDRAVAHFEASIALAKRVAAPLMEARSSLELARLLLDVDPDRHRERAVELAGAAAVTGRVLDSAWLVRSCESLLADVERAAS